MGHDEILYSPPSFHYSRLKSETKALRRTNNWYLNLSMPNLAKLKILQADSLTEQILGW
jgi:hypothetical protein